MDVPLGKVRRVPVVPLALEALNLKPDRSSALRPLLNSSTNSSLPPAGPRARNWLMLRSAACAEVADRMTNSAAQRARRTCVGFIDHSLSRVRGGPHWGRLVSYCDTFAKNIAISLGFAKYLALLGLWARPQATLCPGFRARQPLQIGASRIIGKAAVCRSPPCERSRRLAVTILSACRAQGALLQKSWVCRLLP